MVNKSLALLSAAAGPRDSTSKRTFGISPLNVFSLVLDFLPHCIVFQS